MVVKPTGKIAIIKGVNRSTGKGSKELDFSVKAFGERTRQCAVSAQALGCKKLAIVMVMAQGLLQDDKGPPAPATSKNIDFSLLIDLDED